jgi:hypothetical protein
MLKRLSFSRKSTGGSERFLVKGQSLEQKDAQAIGIVSGQLQVYEKGTLGTKWRSHFMVLASRLEGGLGFYMLDEVAGLWKNATPKLKVCCNAVGNMSQYPFDRE